MDPDDSMAIGMRKMVLTDEARKQIERLTAPDLEADLAAVEKGVGKKATFAEWRAAEEAWPRIRAALAAQEHLLCSLCRALEVEQPGDLHEAVHRLKNEAMIRRKERDEAMFLIRGLELDTQQDQERISALKQAGRTAINSEQARAQRAEALAERLAECVKNVVKQPTSWLGAEWRCAWCGVVEDHNPNCQLAAVLADYEKFAAGRKESEASP